MDVSQESVLIYAETLGIDLEKERNLIPISRVALETMPEGWILKIADGDHEGIPYFFHIATNATEWYHPDHQSYMKQITDFREKAERKSKLRSSAITVSAASQLKKRADTTKRERLSTSNTETLVSPQSSSVESSSVSRMVSAVSNNPIIPLQAFSADYNPPSDNSQAISLLRNDNNQLKQLLASMEAKETAALNNVEMIRKQETDMWSKKISDSKLAIESLTKQVGDSMARSVDKDEAIANRFQATMRDLEAEKRANSEAKTRISDLSSKITQVEVELSQSRQLTSDLNKRLLEANQIQLENEAQRDEVSNESKRLIGRLKRFEVQLLEHEEEKRKLFTEIAIQEDQLKKYKGSEGNTIGKIEMLESDVSRLTNDRHLEVTSFQRRIMEMAAEISNLKSQLAGSMIDRHKEYLVEKRRADEKESENGFLQTLNHRLQSKIDEDSNLMGNIKQEANKLKLEMMEMEASHRLEVKMMRYDLESKDASLKETCDKLYRVMELCKAREIQIEEMQTEAERNRNELELEINTKLTEIASETVLQLQQRYQHERDQYKNRIMQLESNESVLKHDIMQLKKMSRQQTDLYEQSLANMTAAANSGERIMTDDDNDVDEKISSSRRRKKHQNESISPSMTRAMADLTCSLDLIRSRCQELSKDVRYDSPVKQDDDRQMVQETKLDVRELNIMMAEKGPIVIENPDPPAIVTPSKYNFSGQAVRYHANRVLNSTAASSFNTMSSMMMETPNQIDSSSIMLSNSSSVVDSRYQRGLWKSKYSKRLI